MLLVKGALAFLTATGVLADVALHAPTDLVAAAAASGRPLECTPGRALKASTAGPSSPRQASLRGKTGVWSRARTPNLERYCALIARAHARIDENPTAARIAAEQADALVPNRAAPLVVLARVALMEGDVPKAVERFHAALARDPRAVEQPVAMHDLARAELRSGKLDQALATFRVLVPRASLLPDREHRARVLLEAAHVAMASAATPSDETGRVLDEALAYLREATRDTHHRLELDVALSLVLALDRTGQRLQADAILSEQVSSPSWAGTAALDYLVTPDDAHVMRGLALEDHDPAAAAASYRAYLDTKSGQGAYGEAVKARLAALVAPTSKRRGNP